MVDAKGEPFKIEKTVLWEVIDRFPKTSYVEGQMLLRDAYDQAFGVFDHLQQRINEQSTSDPTNKRPLSSVAYHYPEDTEGVTITATVRTFAQLRIYERFGLSLTEFLELPHEYTQVVLREAETLMGRLESDQNRIMADIQNSARRG